jgi:predicted TIM-barrel fold metal-dependent hydrolase
MIVDLDTRLWPRIEDLGDELAAAVRLLGSARWLQPDATGEAHAAAGRAVDAAVVLGFRSELVRGAIPEAMLRGAIERSERRLYLARAIDPLRSDASAEVESARKEGAAAIWMDPCTQGFNPTDTRAMRVFDRAEANQLPVFLGWSGPMPSSARLEFARPFLLDEVARSFPRLSIVIAGFGSPFMAETLALLGKHDHVFTTTACVASRPWDLLNALQGARDHGVDRKVCFGSGFPFDTPARAIEAIYGVNTLIHGTQLPHIARSVLREIVERDAISLLGLGVPPVPNPRDTTRALATDAPLRFGGETG